MRGRVGVIAVASLFAVLAGYATADAFDALPAGLPSLLTLDEPWVEPSPFPTVALDPPPTAPAVLPDLDAEAPVPNPAWFAELASTLASDARLGPGVGVVVLDAATGDVLADAGGAVARTPASTIKLLTTTAALVALGEDARLRTTVVAGPDVATDAAAAGVATGTIYLVGGGDILLAAGAGAGDGGAVVGRAGVGGLAARTAEALTARGVTSVRVALDDTAFTGATTAPGWGSIDIDGGFAMPVAPLAIDHGIVVGLTPRDADPALTAATTFATALAGAGIAVEGEVTRAAAPAGGAELAAVESATIGRLVAHTLEVSDNDVADVLARLVAREAGLPATFEGGSEAVLAQLGELGLDVSGVSMADGSGLSTLNRVPPLLLARLAALTTDPAHPELLPIANGVPIAGLTGTLEDRFALDGDAAAGAGVLRAKTGTLASVVALAGTVLDADGRLLAIAVIADAVPAGGIDAARAVIDDWAAALATGPTP